MKYLLLGTAGCHLCEQAEVLIKECLIAELGVSLGLIDIAEETDWQADYATRIPVILHQASKQSLNWPFTQDEVHTFIEHYHD